MHRNIVPPRVSLLTGGFGDNDRNATAILANPGPASSMDGAIYSEETLDRTMPNQEIPLDSLATWVVC